MQKAQEFLVDHIKALGDSLDVIEEKSTISRSTAHRIMTGQSVSSHSLRCVAEAYGVMDEFLALVSAASDPKRAADELHEVYLHAEQLLTENCEERIHAIKMQLIANEKAHAKELENIITSDKRIIDTLEKSLASEKAHARSFLWLFIISASFCVILVLILAYFVGYDLTYHEMSFFS